MAPPIYVSRCSLNFVSSSVILIECEVTPSFVYGLPVLRKYKLLNSAMLLLEVETAAAEQPISCRARFSMPLLKGLLRVMPNKVCNEWGRFFLAGVRPDSPSRSDTFLLLRVAAMLRRGGRGGSYVVR